MECAACCSLIPANQPMLHSDNLACMDGVSPEKFRLIEFAKHAFRYSPFVKKNFFVQTFPLDNVILFMYNKGTTKQIDTIRADEPFRQSFCCSQNSVSMGCNASEI